MRRFGRFLGELIGKDDGRDFAAIGTTPPITVPKGGDKTAVQPGAGYFLIKVHAAQAAFLGSIWEQARQLVITSTVSLNLPSLGPTRGIQRIRPVERRKSVQLGLASDLVELTPATMDRVSISIDFMLDRKNRLASLAGLINDNKFRSAIGLAPGAAAIAASVGQIASAVINTFLDTRSQRPIMTFTGDFNLVTGDLSSSYQVIVGTDGKSPLPKPMPKFTVQNAELLADGNPVTRWSYVVLDVSCAPARTKDLGREAPWYGKLVEVDVLAQGIGAFSTQPAREAAWKQCEDLLKQAHLMLRMDPLYLPNEAEDIVRTAYSKAYDRIFPPDRANLGAPPLIQAEVQQFLGVESDEDLRSAVARYAQDVDRSRPTWTSAGLLG